MRHRNSRLRLNEKPSHAAMVQRNLVTSLVLYEAIRTTKKRARVIQPIFDRLITIAKTKEPREAVRALNVVVTHRNASRKVMEVLKSRYATRTSGYTRVIPVGARKGDGAELVDLELMDRGSSEASAKADASEKPAKKSSAKKAK